VFTLFLFSFDLNQLLREMAGSLAAKCQQCSPPVCLLCLAWQVTYSQFVEQICFKGVKKRLTQNSKVEGSKTKDLS